MFGVKPWEMQDFDIDELNAMTQHINQMAEAK